MARPPIPSATTASTGTCGSIIASGPWSRSAAENACADRYAVSMSLSAASRAVG